MRRSQRTSHHNAERGVERPRLARGSVDMPSYSFKTAATAVVSGIKMQNAAAGECVKVRAEAQNIIAVEVGTATSYPTARPSSNAG